MTLVNHHLMLHENQMSSLHETYTVEELLQQIQEGIIPSAPGFFTKRECRIKSWHNDKMYSIPEEIYATSEPTSNPVSGKSIHRFKPSREVPEHYPTEADIERFNSYL